ncbi:hypothetical protein [Albibacillus kandeliae]|uniref:hypothetical protein n=1 Tax=Albibacillus kandeliae TaxID=2174228 RepID=UPI000D68AF3F|nr:hypothetical protein [Albibacillus kandeliae]
MKVAETYQALNGDTPPAHLLRAGGAFTLKTALLLLAEFESLPLVAMSYSGTELATKFPRDVIPVQAQGTFKSELTRYQSWRRRLLDLQLLTDGTRVDDDPITGLQRVARIEIGDWAVNSFYTLRKVLPEATDPAAIDRSIALRINAELSGFVLSNFRQSISVMDRLQESALAKGTGLLPAEPIGPLPSDSDHRRYAPLPDKLAKEFERAPANVRCAIPFIYRIAVMRGLISSSENISTKDLVCGSNEVVLLGLDPAEFGFERPAKATLKIYVQRLVRHVGPVDAPRRSSADPVEHAWSELRHELSRRGLKSVMNRTIAVSGQAVPQSLRPADITPGWIVETEMSLSGTKLSQFRTGIFAIDALSELHDFPSSLLPNSKSGLVRQRRPAKKKDR